MTTTSDTLVDLVVAALRAAEICGGNVWSYRDWPTKPVDNPIALMDLPEEEKTSLGRSGGPHFTVLATLTLTVRMSRPAEPGDLGALRLQSDLGVMRRDIEVAVINDPDLFAKIQHMPFVRSSLHIESKEQHLGELRMQMGLEFYQGLDDFHPPPDQALEQLVLEAENYPGAGLDLALDA